MTSNLSLIKRYQVFIWPTYYCCSWIVALSLCLWDRTQNTNAIELYSTSHCNALTWFVFYVSFFGNYTLSLSFDWPSLMFVCSLLFHRACFIVPWISLSSYHSLKPNPPKIWTHYYDLNCILSWWKGREATKSGSSSSSAASSCWIRRSDSFLQLREIQFWIFTF